MILKRRKKIKKKKKIGRGVGGRRQRDKNKKY